MKSEQKELLALLPVSIKKSKYFSEKAKLVLADLIYFNNSDFAKTNGYFYKTNSDLMADSGLSNKGIGIVLNRFIELGFISRIVGKFKGNASEYRVNLSAIENYPKGEVKGEVDPKSEVSKFTLSDLNKILSTVEAMEQQIKDLQNEVVRLKGEVKALSKGEVERVKFTTDTESDTESEKETLNTNSTGTCKVEITSNNFEVLSDGESERTEETTDGKEIEYRSLENIKDELFRWENSRVKTAPRYEELTGNIVSDRQGMEDSFRWYGNYLRENTGENYYNIAHIYERACEAKRS